MSKQIFRFYTDEKMTIWHRKHFEVEAESYDEAKSEAIRQAKEEDYEDYGTWEPQDDTLEGMTPKENDNQPTQEVYYAGDKFPLVIYDNTQLDIVK